MDSSQADDVEPYYGVSGNMLISEVSTANKASYNGKRKRSGVQSQETVSLKRGCPALRRALLQFTNNLYSK